MKNRIIKLIIDAVWVFIWFVMIILTIFFTLELDELEFGFFITLSVVLGWLWPIITGLILFIPLWIFNFYQSVVNYIIEGKFKADNFLWNFIKIILEDYMKGKDYENT